MTAAMTPPATPQTPVKESCPEWPVGLRHVARAHGDIGRRLDGADAGAFFCRYAVGRVDGGIGRVIVIAARKTAQR